jgi:hypothetical protein
LNLRRHLTLVFLNISVARLESHPT